MYFPNNWVKLLNICECGNNMIITATPIGYHLAIKSKFKNQAGLLAYVIQLIEWMYQLKVGTSMGVVIL